MSRKIILEDNFTEENDNWVEFAGIFTKIDYEKEYAFTAWRGSIVSKEFSCEGLKDVTITYDMFGSTYRSHAAIQWWTGNEWKPVVYVSNRGGYVGEFKITDPSWLNKNNKIKLSMSSPDDIYKIYVYDLKIDAESGDRYLFSENNEFKTFDLFNLKWTTMKLDNKTTETKGISDLSNLVQNTTKNFKSENKTTLNSGQQFTQPINLKSFKTINNIGVMYSG